MMRIVAAARVHAEIMNHHKREEKRKICIKVNILIIIIIIIIIIAPYESYPCLLIQ